MLARRSRAGHTPMMRLGDIANAAATGYGKPLDGVRILAAEQMQALPFATQLLARLGAEVVKVEHPVHGESGRGSSPAMVDPDGRSVGATYLRNNLDKRSVGLDLKSPEGRDLFIRLAGRFDIVAENFKAGTMERMGLGYDDIAAVHPHRDLPVADGVRQRLGRRRGARLGGHPVPLVAGLCVGRRGHVGDLRVQVGARRPARHHSGRRARRHLVGPLRGRGPPRGTAPPGSHGRGPVHRHRHARCGDRHDRCRDQLLVDGCAVPRAPGDLRGVPGKRRLRRVPDRARAAVLHPG